MAGNLQCHHESVATSSFQAQSCWTCEGAPATAPEVSFVSRLIMRPSGLVWKNDIGALQRSGSNCTGRSKDEYRFKAEYAGIACDVAMQLQGSMAALRAEHRQHNLVGSSLHDGDGGVGCDYSSRGNRQAAVHRKQLGQHVIVLVGSVAGGQS